MNLKAKLVSLIFFTCILGLFFSKPAFADTFTLSGKVSDSSGIAIVNATVSVNDANSDSTTTNSSGNYSISIPQGTYNVQVVPPSGSSFSSAIAVNQNITSNTTLNFILVSAGTAIFSGHVYNAQGNPVPGQEVALAQNGSTVVDSVTDSSGSYSMQATTGSYVLEILGRSNAPSLQVPENYDFSVDYSLTQSTTQDITIPTNQVSIHVQDASGTGISGVNVTTQLGAGSGYSLGGGITGATGDDAYNTNGPTTDQSGNVTLWLLAGTYTFNAVPPSGSNFSSITLSNVNVSGTMQETITLPQPLTLSGHVYNTQGDPVPGQEVALFSNGSTVTYAITDSSGNYSLQAATNTYVLAILGRSNGPSLKVPENYDLSVDYSLTQSTTQDITIPANQVSIHVQGASGATVSGVNVTTQLGAGSGYSLGEGITGATGDDTYNSNGPTTNQSGDVTLWLLAGKYTLNATPPSGSNFSSTTLSNVNVSGTTQETITLPQPVTFSGHVYNAQGQPVPGQEVALFQNGSTVAYNYTDPSGGYSMQATTGSYQLGILGRSNAPSLEVPENYDLSVNYSLTQSTTQDITIPANQVSIHVQGPSSTAVTGVNVTTQLGAGSGYSLGGGITGATGDDTYNINGPTTDQSGNVTLWLLAGNYILNATPPNGSVYSEFSLNNVSVTGNQTELISLQYSHNPPVTTASLATQNSDGTYSDPTTITLSEVTASGYTVMNIYYTIDGGAQQTYTAPFTVTGSGSHTITYWSIDNSGVQEAYNSKTFTITEAYNLVGTVYSDANQNGVQDSGETGYANATVTLDNGQTTTADNNGNYTFSNVEAGTYTETLTVPSGYLATTTNPANIPLGANTTENFGIALIPTPTNTPTPTNASPVIGAVIVTPNPVKINTSTTGSASFTDVNTSDTHTVQWNWGDGHTTNGTVTESNGSGSVSNNHTYTALGSYTITLTVTDNTNLNGTSHKVVAVIPTNGLRGSNLSHKNYTGADLSGQNISNANLSVATFNNVDFQSANLSQVNGSNSSFTNDNFTGANLHGSNFSNANLTGSNLTNAIITGANWSNANLTNVNFTGVNLQGANLSGTTKTGIIWSNTICPDGTNSNNHNNTCIGHGGGL